MPISTPSYFAGSGGAALAPAARWVSIDRVRNPWAMVRAERRGCGPLRVDVDELVVVGDVGELVHLVLGHLEPLAGAFVGADVGLEQLERLGCCFTHGAAP